MSRYASSIALVAALALAGCQPAAPPKSPSYDAAMADLKTGAAVSAMEAAMAKGTYTSADLTQAALDQIRAEDGAVHAVIAINPDAMTEAKAVDDARKTGKNLGPLMGIPVLVKDNVETLDPVATTAGSLALKDNITHRDAPVIANLRAGGAIILAKTNLSEWANIRSTRSVSGWSGVGGLTHNAIDPTRTACGSSSGSGAGVAAHMAPLAVGTETDGSVTCPSSMEGLVGLKPTIGLVSRTWVVPISHTQDTPGPMGHSVEDVAAMLGVMAGSDPQDKATAAADSHKTDYTAGLSADGLKGLRIGVLDDEIGKDDKTTAVFDQALQTLTDAGAVVVHIKSSEVKGLGDAENTVLHVELKADLGTYLAATPVTVKTRTLADVIAFDTQNADKEMPYFGQEYFEQAEETKGLADPDYLKALKIDREGSAAMIDGLLKDNNVSVLIAPTYGPAWLSDLVYGDQYNGPSATQLPATAGYPHLTVPMGTVQGLPVGLSFIGTAWSEPTLLKAGYAFEQARKGKS